MALLDVEIIGQVPRAFNDEFDFRLRSSGKIYRAVVREENSVQQGKLGDFQIRVLPETADDLFRANCTKFLMFSTDTLRGTISEHADFGPMQQRIACLEPAGA